MNTRHETTCESGCSYHGVTDFVTNTLMKVQHVAESENSVLGDSYYLGKRDGICGMD